MADIDITTEGDSIFLTAPYNAAANRGYRNAGGKWQPERKAWKFKAKDIQLVRGVLNEHFGYTDEVTETVDVRVYVRDWEDGNHENTATFAGRIIAVRRSRDADVALGRDVLLIKGSFDGSGGSMRYPTIDANKDVIVEVRGVPAGHRDLGEDNVEIVEHRVDVEALQVEREKLLARIAEIDAQLATE